MSHVLPPLSRAQVRSIDQTAIRDFGISGLVLMENAGRGCAETIDRISPSGAVAILCGRGNNAGDGYVVARHLQVAGRRVQIIQLHDPAELGGDAMANWLIVQKAQIPYCVVTGSDERAIAEAIGTSATIVDAMLGTGAAGNPRQPIATAIRVANRINAVRIAIDIPSGLDCDLGVPGDPCLRADHTCTMVATKIGFTNPAAQPFTGTVHTIGIGVPLRLLETLEP